MPRCFAFLFGLFVGFGSAALLLVVFVFLLRLQVVGCTPRIWRRLLVRETMWVTRLHDCIQIAFDWFDYQTHVFVLDNLRFGNPQQREDASVEDDRDITLTDFDLGSRDRFLYEY